MPAARIYTRSSTDKTDSLASYNSHFNEDDIQSEQNTDEYNEKETDYELNVANTKLVDEINQGVVESEATIKSGRLGVEMDSQQNSGNRITSSNKDTPTTAFNVYSSKVYYKDAQTQTLPQIFATGHISLTVETKNIFVEDVPTQYRIEFDLPFESGKNTKETNDQKEKLCCFPVPKRVKLYSQTPQSPKKTPARSISPTEQVLTSAEATQKMSGEGARQSKRRRANAPSAEKCGSETHSCDKERP